MKEKAIIILAIVILVGAGVLIWINFYNYRPVARNFDDCVKYGYTVSNLRPRECTTPEGKIFKESINPAEQLREFLQIEDLKIGNGETAETGDTLTVHYVGTLKDGAKFDSSRDRNQSFEFKLGAGKVIPGWDFGLIGMKVGGKRKLIIDPLLAYGDRQVGSIPSNSTLIFEVELLKIKK